MTRLPFLDWTRGIAVLIMIECHTFNSLVRPELRRCGPYMLSQLVGGMAAVLFLFLAGVTFAFQMDRLDRRGAGRRERLAGMLRRAGYMLAMAFLFRLSMSGFTWGDSFWRSLLKVDILNCMGVSMALLAGLSLWPPRRRAQAAGLAGLAVACASPLVSAADWSGVPWALRDYLVPNRAAFPLFPWSAYLAFGVACGAVLRRLAPGRLERALQWAVLAGFSLVLGGRYFSGLPYSFYEKAEFWLDSPGLVIIRLGIVLVMLAAAYLWTEHAAGPGWSWVQALGRTSLLVYWVHVALVYGWTAEPFQRALTIPQTVAATALVVALMVALAAARLRWSAGRRKPAPEIPALERARGVLSLAFQVVRFY